jgi:hypothetical protein
MRRLPLVMVLALLIGGCGGSDGDNSVRLPAVTTTPTGQPMMKLQTSDDADRLCEQLQADWPDTVDGDQVSLRTPGNERDVTCVRG